MIQIIYRIYEKTEELAQGWINHNIMICQEIMQCESREHFKEIIRDMYGKDIAFKNTSKLELGKLYCTIISENPYNVEDYFRVFKYKCDNCGKEWLQNGRKYINTFREYFIERESPEFLKLHKEELHKKIFCCQKCRDSFEEKYINEAIEYRKNNDDVKDIWIDKDTFSSYSNGGYIYMISKKSTGEFYVGQTKNLPIFRWGQHLLTNRFNIENIVDYKFEVLEVVKNLDNLNNREAYWINEKRNENPKLSLNIQIPQEKLKLF